MSGWKEVAGSFHSGVFSKKKSSAEDEREESP